MRSHQLAYIAGFIDGDGCISVGSPSHRSRVRIVLKETDKNVLDLFHQLFGGYLLYRKCSPAWRHKVNGSFVSNQWEWGIRKQKDLLRFLTEVEPYLVLKRVKAQAAIQEIKTRPRMKEAA